MKKYITPSHCTFLLLFCCIICTLIAYPGLNTLEAATSKQSFTTEEVLLKQQELEISLNNLNLNLVELSDRLNTYYEQLTTLENQLSTTQNLLVTYYMDQLADPHYVKTYNTDYIWYTAAEALGALGKPAIPSLINRLDTTDTYERSLVFYALLLASQAENVKAFAGNDYIHTYLDFDINNHSAQKEIALKWWKKYKQYF